MTTEHPNNSINQDKTESKPDSHRQTNRLPAQLIQNHNHTRPPLHTKGHQRQTTPPSNPTEKTHWKLILRVCICKSSAPLYAQSGNSQLSEKP